MNHLNEMQNTSKLTQAREYEAQQAAQSDLLRKPVYHVTAPVGWMNDPNGFSCYQGEYHLFYQYHPYSNQWGPMHWGHFRTKDFITWEQLPCALAPDTDYDGQGCFSGSALEHEGKHILMYTSVKECALEDGTRAVRQTQSIAEGDGTNYSKSEQNPVITADALPKGSSVADFRDPKIWKEGDTFHAVIGSLGEDGTGQIALFSSEDLQKWKFESILDANHGQYGKMWECPDFFALDDKWVLITSPQFMTAEGLEFHNGNNSVYFVGDFDREEKRFLRGEARQIDHGLDFYAPQTVETQDGRRVMVAWMQSWDNYMTPDDADWSGMMTIPRELSLKGGRLLQQPVRELEQYRKNEVKHERVKIGRKDGAVTLQGISGRVLDMTLELTAGEYDTFEIALAADEKHCTRLIYDRKKGTLTTDRLYSGLKRDLIERRSAYVEEKDGMLRLRILLDRFSVEVFVNDGETVMSTVIYTDQSASDIRFACDGEAEVTVVKYDLV